MGQKAVPAALNRKHLTKAEREKRSSAENKLRGTANKIRRPGDLTKEQKKYFAFFVKLLSPSEILSSMDVEILRSAAVSADRVHYMNAEIDKDKTLLKSAPYMSALKFYTIELNRCLIELGMTPQARAKLALSAKESEDPLIAALTMNDEEDEEDEEE
ncbi:MAG: P27 family phage terminase small subunit [Ruminococcus sp.]|nr:P27 family phage terminase small subunit [Ruminococcus sp.]